MFLKKLQILFWLVKFQLDNLSLLYLFSLDISFEWKNNIFLTENASRQDVQPA